MTTMSQAAGNTGSGTAGTGKVFGQALLGGAAAAVLNLVLFLGAKAAGVPMTGEFEPGKLGELMLPMVVISSVVPGVFAALAGLAFQKFTPAAAARNFAILAIVFGAFSLGGPASVKQISTGTIVVMDLMHLIAGVAIGGMVFRSLKKG